MEKKFITVKFPLEFDEDGKYKLYDSDDLVRIINQNIKNILLTVPGEFIFNSNFGVGLRKLLFEFPNTIDNSSINSRIMNQLRTYAPYITVLDVSLQMNLETPKISLRYIVDETNQEQTYDLHFADGNDPR